MAVINNTNSSWDLLDSGSFSGTTGTIFNKDYSGNYQAIKIAFIMATNGADAFGFQLNNDTTAGNYTNDYWVKQTRTTSTAILPGVLIGSGSGNEQGEFDARLNTGGGSRLCSRVSTWSLLTTNGERCKWNGGSVTLTRVDWVSAAGAVTISGSWSLYGLRK